MGKGKSKKKRQPRRYNKKQFKGMICHRCGLCSKDVNPIFCYVQLYRKDPKGFVNHILPKLSDVRSYYHSLTTTPKDMEIPQFTQMFCISAPCHSRLPIAPRVADECLEAPECFTLFKSQLADTVKPAAVGKAARKARKRKRKQEAKTVVQPYATFIIKDDEVFKDTVRKILYGDGDREQADTKAATGKDKEDSSKSAEGGES